MCIVIHQIGFRESDEEKNHSHCDTSPQSLFTGAALTLERRMPADSQSNLGGAGNTGRHAREPEGQEMWKERIREAEK